MGWVKGSQGQRNTIEKKSSLGAFSVWKLYRAFHVFGQAKFSDGSSVLGSS